MDIQYYPSKTDYIWNAEVTKLIPYMQGNGLDIGCGMRTAFKEMKRLDIDPSKSPDILGDMCELPVGDNTFDFITSIHSFEHVEDQEKALKEWLRVLKPRGYILIVHPDKNFTGVQKPPVADKMEATDFYNIHYHERTLNEMIEWLNNHTYLGYTLDDWGIAYPNWSFYIVVRKTS